MTSTQRGINTLPIKETKDLLLYAVLKVRVMLLFFDRETKEFLLSTAYLHVQDNNLQSLFYFEHRNFSILFPIAGLECRNFI